METSHVFFTAPGPVSALMAQPIFASIVLTWSAPQEPNGVLISYEVTYRELMIVTLVIKVAIVFTCSVKVSW